MVAPEVGLGTRRVADFSACSTRLAFWLLGPAAGCTFDLDEDESAL